MACHQGDHLVAARRIPFVPFIALAVAGCVAHTNAPAPAPLVCDRAASDSTIAAIRARGDTMAGLTVPPTMLHGPGSIQYPDSLKETGLNGEVAYDIVVGADGRVDPCLIRVVSASNPAFIGYGIQALRVLEYSPALRAGERVPFLTRLTVHWEVQGGSRD